MAIKWRNDLIVYVKVYSETAEALRGEARFGLLGRG
jgi:hypothetical protein